MGLCASKEPNQEQENKAKEHASGDYISHVPLLAKPEEKKVLAKDGQCFEGVVPPERHHVSLSQREIYATLLSSLVRLRTSKSRGTGFYLKDGNSIHVRSSDHLISEEASSLQVCQGDTISKVLTICPQQPLSFPWELVPGANALEPNFSPDIQPGDTVYFAGYPFENDAAHVHTGTISAVGEGYFKIDGISVRGMSGGPIAIVQQNRLFVIGTISDATFAPQDEFAKWRGQLQRTHGAARDEQDFHDNHVVEAKTQMAKMADGTGIPYEEMNDIDMPYATNFDKDLQFTTSILTLVDSLSTGIIKGHLLRLCVCAAANCYPPQRQVDDMPLAYTKERTQSFSSREFTLLSMFSDRFRQCYQNTKEGGKEYGGWIFMSETKARIIGQDPKKATPSGIILKGWRTYVSKEDQKFFEDNKMELAAYFHCHPGYDPDNERPSPGDIKSANEEKDVSYFVLTSKTQKIKGNYTFGCSVACYDDNVVGNLRVWVVHFETQDDPPPPFVRAPITILTNDLPTSDAQPTTVDTIDMTDKTNKTGTIMNVQTHNKEDLRVTFRFDNKTDVEYTVRSESKQSGTVQKSVDLQSMRKVFVPGATVKITLTSFGMICRAENGTDVYQNSSAQTPTYDPNVF